MAFRPLRFCALGLPLVLLLCAGRLAAQERVAACEQGRISSIFIDNHSVFDLSDPDLEGRLEWAYRLVNRMHIRTRPEVLRRELLFEEGDCLEPDLLRDSERILRAAPFIADVDLYGIRQEDGSVHVIVDTQDEWSLRVQPDSRGFAVREENLLGWGRQLRLFYEDSHDARVYGVGYRTPQLFETDWDAGFDASRTPTGYRIGESLTFPFLGEAGRWAFRQSVRHSDRYFEYVWMPPAPVLGEDRLAIWFPERRQSFDLGTAFRWRGRGQNRTLLGVALTGERITYPTPPRFAADELRADGYPLPDANFAVDTTASVRLMLLAGQRNVYFVRRRALDTVNAKEDVRLGVQAELALGPSLTMLSDRDDLALSLGLFTGGELPGGVLTGAQFSLQGHRGTQGPPTESEWDDVFGELDVWAYWRPGEDSRQTYVASVAAAGGWHTSVPFQLTLGEEVGMRGYPRYAYPGARRVVLSLEQRSYLRWPLPEALDLGTVLFADAGRMWAGNVAFGEDSPWLVDVGVGLRAAFPAGSRQTFRLDVGVPLLAGERFGGVVLSVGVGQSIGAGVSRRDPQMLRSARQGMSTSLFVFPN